MIEGFMEAARRVGAAVERCPDLAAAVDYVRRNAGGTLLLPTFASGERLGIAERLREAGVEVLDADFRQHAPKAAAGLTGANFAIADTGSVVLESTPEPIRLATTLPERHFVLVDAGKVVANGLEAAPILRQFHQSQPRNYLAYITGPSRTADIERVLTIGVHGPKELHVLVLEGISDDYLEM
ncbi:hypothetical protein DESUT3_05990 [Desulfuromonas versatilis]|uniref:LUD domain-containing protein n=1 Tax=Desulfuromonas versatilis TaxID=2802975 RepID=A0ABM8HST7_9BACT|nr:hypothetical protein DESUT3_05990 [Desulfuromonas versatilis]